MIWASENSRLDKLLSERFIFSATASTLAHRFQPENRIFILTSDI